MKILSSSEIDRDAWRKLVETSGTGTWFQTPEAYDFFASMPDLFKPFVVAISNEAPLSEAQHSINPSLQTLRAVCVGYVTVEKNLVKQFFTRRAIIIGGPALADDASLEEVEALMIAMRDQLTNIKYQILNIKCAPIYIETRNFNDYSKWKDAFDGAGFNYQPHLNFHVDTTSIEVVEANLGRNRKRDIRTSFRDGAAIIDNPTIGQIHEFYTILNQLYATKVRTPLFPLSFFEQLYLHRDARFLLVGIPRENGEIEIIGGTVCVALAGKCLYEWFACGRDGEWKSIFPSSVATYAGIRYAAEHGMPRLDMMGAGKPEEAYGVRDFKARFGGQEVEYGRFICIAKPLLYKIGVIGVKILKTYK